MKQYVLFVVGIASFFFCLNAAGQVTREPAVVELGSPTEVQALVRMGLDIDFVSGSYVRIYATPEEFRKAAASGYLIYWIPNEARAEFEREQAAVKAGEIPLDTYHDYTQLTTLLQNVAAAHPAICQLSSAGKSVQNRELWVMKISDNVTVAEDEPEFRYIANMHGDEVVGKEMLIDLINYLVDNYGTNTTVTNLVNGVEIYIMPLMNPDGNASATRENANGIDLNRNFPDRIDDPVNTPDGRAPETQAVMNFFATRQPVISANFHGGAQVVNYPWDGSTIPDGQYAACPDDDVFITISTTYATTNSDIMSGGFTGGITNGNEWYAIFGGMQDWSYYWQGDMDVTIELSNNKWPNATTLAGFWNRNRDSLLNYLQECLRGVRGTVTDAVSGAPVDATITVSGRDIPFFTDPAVGDYHRRLPSGTYTFNFQATGYLPVTRTNVAITADPATRLDVQMTPTGHVVLDSYSLTELLGNGDAALDPGEIWGLPVTVRNDGNATAHDIQAILTAPGAPVQILNDGFAYGDLAAHVSAASGLPYFRFQILSSAPCGSTLPFHLDIASAEGPNAADFEETLGNPLESHFTSADTPKSIPDNSSTGVKSNISVAGSGLLRGLRLHVDVTHPYVGDLWIQLKSPAGTTAVVWNNQGGSADNIHQDFTLAAFDGENMQGSWELWVKDTGPSDIGTLNSWEIHPTTASCAVYTGLLGDANDNGSVNAQDALVLANYLAGNIAGGGLNLQKADLDGNTVVNVLDVCLLLNSL